MSQKGKIEEEPEIGPKEKAMEMLLDGQPTEKIMEATGLGERTIWGLKGILRKQKRLKVEEEEPTGAPGEIYKGEPDANSILEHILKRHPDITPRIKAEVMDWARLRNGLEPTTLAYLLSNMKGVSAQTANIIAQKYSLALQKAQQEGKINVPFALGTVPLSQPRQPFTMPPTLYPQQQYPYYPYSQPTTGYPTPTYSQPSTGYPSMQPQPYTGYPPPTVQPYTGERERTEEIVKKSMEELKKDYEERLKGLEERILRSLPKHEEKEKNIEVFEPVLDRDGNIVTDSKGEPVFRRVSGPRGLVNPGEDPEVSALRKLRMMRDIVIPKTEGISRDDVRSIVKDVMEESKGKLTPEDVVKLVEERLGKKLEETKPKEEPPELVALRTKLAEQEKKLSEMKETLEAKEKERMEAEIKALREEIRRVESSRAVEGYHADEYRILGQGLDKFATVIEKKEPVKLIIEKAPQLMTVAPGPTGAGAPPPQRQAPPQARRPLLEILRQRGLVVQE